jgi:hypothetical protein
MKRLTRISLLAGGRREEKRHICGGECDGNGGGGRKGGLGSRQAPADRPAIIQ